jgi:hypothetical protein
MKSGRRAKSGNCNCKRLYQHLSRLRLPASVGLSRASRPFECFGVTSFRPFPQLPQTLPFIRPPDFLEYPQLSQIMKYRAGEGLTSFTDSACRTLFFQAFVVLPSVLPKFENHSYTSNKLMVCSGAASSALKSKFA